MNFSQSSLELLWLFCFLRAVNPRSRNRVPFLIPAAVILATILLRLWNPDILTRFENVSYDLRVRSALRFPGPVATNLGFVYIDEETIRAVRDGDFEYKYGLYWPRQVYGRVVEELAAQGVRAVAFDVAFGERRPDHPLVRMGDGFAMESDEFFALQMRQASNTIVAVTPELTLPALFRTNAVAVGDIQTEKDSDGTLRRVRAFRTYRQWHPGFLKAQADPDIQADLVHARVEPGQVTISGAGGAKFTVPLDEHGDFDLADLGGEQLPPGTPRKAKPFVSERVWHMGIVLAARELDLDLEHADVDLAAGRIILRGPGGVERRLPVDRDGFFLIDWCLPPTDKRIFARPMHLVLAQDYHRLKGEGDFVETNGWRGKLAVVGSAVAGGNDLTDHGATPLQNDTLLVSKHWNVANSIITGRFIRRLTLAEEVLLIIGLGALSGVLTWRLRAGPSAVAIGLTGALFIAACFAAYIWGRLWIPLVLPGTGALAVTWASLTAWRVLFEQTERKRVKSVFSKIVSPDVVHELLQAEKLSPLNGARREVTVFFADVRGFTEFTDKSHEAALQHIRSHHLGDADAAKYFDQQAAEALSTVNQYLARVADTVKQHGGTLDKYIGDCVMAFWGAPTPNAQHASACVRAAIDAQRGIHELNELRAAENRRIEAENAAATASGQPSKPLLPLLSLGTGINTGLATVGLMGSDAHILNYTVFGRDVNLASRLEGVSGRGRIIISEATYQHLRRDDSKLAATCVELPPVEVKGIREAVRIYEVPWRQQPVGN
ncbi:MAG: hypothetical protein RLY20_2807 [Verrucomicrobiota bacterium]